MGTNGFSSPKRPSEADRNVGPVRLGDVLADLLGENGWNVAGENREEASRPALVLAPTSSFVDAASLAQAAPILV